MQSRDVGRNRTATKDVSVALTHGAWAHGSSWAWVITALKAEGVKVSAAPAPLPMTSLADDVAALNRSPDCTEGRIVLPRHTYAGAVIALARPKRVKALVMVASHEGETKANAVDHTRSVTAITAVVYHPTTQARLGSTPHAGGINHGCLATRDPC